MHPPGTVIVVTGDLSRYTRFSVSLQGLITPPGSWLTWREGVNVAANLNAALRQRRGDWVWLLGDDHEFEPDCLMRLLAHDVDMVAPFVLRRESVARTVAYRIVEGHLCEVSAGGLPESGTFRVDAVGGAGLLVRERVFAAMTDPWFEVGRMNPDQQSEDVWFGLKAMKLGFSCFLDLDTLMGHTTPATIWPEWKDGRWQATARLGDEHA